MSPSQDAESPSAYAPIGQVPVADDPTVRVGGVQPGSRAGMLMKVLFVLIIVMGLVTAARQQTTSSARGMELQPTRIIGLSSIVPGYKCAPGSCPSWAFAGNSTASGLDIRGCSEFVDAYYPNATGFLLIGIGSNMDQDERWCTSLYDGHCNIFEDNGWNWMNLGTATTCTKIVTKVATGWKYLTCTDFHKDVAVTRGTSSTESWAEGAEFEIGLSEAVKATSKFSHTSATEISESVTETAHLTPKDGEQNCLWQWSSRVHGPPSKGWIDYGYSEWVLTPLPDMKPQCVPGQFNLSDINRQTCLSEEYKLD